MTTNPSNLPSARRFRLRWPVVVLVALPVLIALFYAEEDWRGRRAWEAYKQERIAVGEDLDKPRFELPSVPDDQNFYKTPLLAAVGYRNTNKPLPSLTCSWLCGDPCRAVGSMAEGTRTKLSGYYDCIRTNPMYSAPPTSLEPAADIVRLFKRFPEIQELRSASQRPFSQCNGMTNYFSDTIPNFVVVRNFAQGFTLAAKADLDSGDCEAAAVDARVVLKFADSLRGNSTLVSRMIRVAVIGLYTQTFWEGWADQRWTDKQYEEFQKTFLAINLFEDYNQAFSGEEWGVSQIMESKRLAGLLNQTTQSSSSFDLFKLSVKVAPSGWYYQNLVCYRRAMDDARLGMDGENKRYDSMLGEAAVKRCDKLFEGPHASTMLVAVALPHYSKTRAVCIRQQAYVNEAAIVCALERYRHAQGRYPASLSELSPRFIDNIPSDVIGDQPLRYTVTDAGFRLYSVGMDAQDDGGCLPKDASSSDPCDWVWIKPTAESL